MVQAQADPPGKREDARGQEQRRELILIIDRAEVPHRVIDPQLKCQLLELHTGRAVG